MITFALASRTASASTAIERWKLTGSRTSLLWSVCVWKKEERSKEKKGEKGKRKEENKNGPCVNIKEELLASPRPLACRADREVQPLQVHWASKYTEALTSPPSPLWLLRKVRGREKRECSLVNRYCTHTQTDSHQHRSEQCSSSLSLSFSEARTHTYPRPWSPRRGWHAPPGWCSPALRVSRWASSCRGHCATSSRWAVGWHYRNHRHWPRQSSAAIFGSRRRRPRPRWHCPLWAPVKVGEKRSNHSINRAEVIMKQREGRKRVMRVCMAEQHITHAHTIHTKHHVTLLVITPVCGCPLPK